MQAKVKDISLVVKPPPSIMAWLVSIRVWAWAESEGHPAPQRTERRWLFPIGH